MLIMGCDLHTRYQEIAVLDTAAGEVVTRRLEDENGTSRSGEAARAVEVVRLSWVHGHRRLTSSAQIFSRRFVRRGANPPRRTGQRRNQRKTLDRPPPAACASIRNPPAINAPHLQSVIVNHPSAILRAPSPQPRIPSP
jgi:hypothetical protein